MKKKTIVTKQDYLYNKAISIIDKGRTNIVASIYQETTKSYYLLGKLIVEDEQEGKEKAEYGKNIIKNLSKKLTAKYGKGFSTSTLWDCQKFYKKLQSLTGELECNKNYSLPEDNKQIFASKYKLYLPSKRELEEELFKKEQ